jgi:hypothetical protein
MLSPPQARGRARRRSGSVGRIVRGMDAALEAPMDGFTASRPADPEWRLRRWMRAVDVPTMDNAQRKDPVRSRPR